MLLFISNETVVNSTTPSTEPSDQIPLLTLILGIVAFVVWLVWGIAFGLCLKARCSLVEAGYKSVSDMVSYNGRCCCAIPPRTPQNESVSKDDVNVNLNNDCCDNQACLRQSGYCTGILLAFVIFFLFSLHISSVRRKKAGTFIEDFFSLADYVISFCILLLLFPNKLGDQRCKRCGCNSIEIKYLRCCSRRMHFIGTLMFFIVYPVLSAIDYALLLFACHHFKWTNWITFISFVLASVFSLNFFCKENGIKHVDESRISRTEIIERLERESNFFIVHVDREPNMSRDIQENALIYNFDREQYVNELRKQLFTDPAPGADGPMENISSINAVTTTGESKVKPDRLDFNDEACEEEQKFIRRNYRMHKGVWCRFAYQPEIKKKLRGSVCCEFWIIIFFVLLKILESLKTMGLDIKTNSKTRTC